MWANVRASRSSIMENDISSDTDLYPVVLKICRPRETAVPPSELQRYYISKYNETSDRASGRAMRA